MATDPEPLTAAIFDLGGVLIDWNPRHLYRELFEDPAAMELFLATVCTPEWNATLDAGRPLADAVADLSTQHPNHSGLIAVYSERWEMMLAGAYEDTVEVLDELRNNGVRIFALTNWSVETFPFAIARYPFLDWFEDIVVSGQERLVKPDAAIYELATRRFGIDPEQTVFIDDVLDNVIAATEAGMRGHRYVGASELRSYLASQGALDDNLDPVEERE